VHVYAYLANRADLDAKTVLRAFRAVNNGMNMQLLPETGANGRGGRSGRGGIEAFCMFMPLLFSCARRA
jgi:hypothetical protein